MNIGIDFDGVFTDLGLSELDVYKRQQWAFVRKGSKLSGEVWPGMQKTG